MAERILRFHPADKIFHAVNAVTWFDDQVVPQLRRLPASFLQDPVRSGGSSAPRSLQRRPKDELPHFLLHDVWSCRHRLDALLLRSGDSEGRFLVDVHVPCLGLHHLLVDGRRCSHPVGSALLGTLQGYLGSGRRHDLLRSCRTPLSEVA